MHRYSGQEFHTHLLAMLMPFVTADWVVCPMPCLPAPRWALRHVVGDPVAVCHLPTGYGLVLTPCSQQMGTELYPQMAHTWHVWCVSRIQAAEVGYVRDLWILNRQIGETPFDSLDRTLGVSVKALHQKFFHRIQGACLREHIDLHRVSVTHYPLTASLLHHMQATAGSVQLRIDLGAPSAELYGSYTLQKLSYTDTRWSYPRRWYLTEFFDSFPQYIELPTSAHARAACLRDQEDLP